MSRNRLRTWHFNGILYISIILWKVSWNYPKHSKFNRIVCYLSNTRYEHLRFMSYTTHSSIISTCKPIQGLSNHDAVFINLSLSLHHIKNHPHKILLYKIADWDIMYNKLLDISEEYFQLNDTSPRSIVENYHFTEVINDYEPFKSAHKRTHLPWMIVELKCLIRKIMCVHV